MNPYNLDALREEDVQAFVDAKLNEGARLDYKGADLPEDLEDTVAAMASSEGGQIVLGVEERQTIPLQVVGMRAKRADLALRIQQRILAHVTPQPTFRIGVAMMRDEPTRLVGIIEVDRGDHPPYASHQDRFLVRRGPANVRANINDIEQMIARRGAHRRQLNERLSSFHEQPVQPRGGLSDNDARRFVRLQVDIAPIAPLDLLMDTRVEQSMLALIAQVFGWTDSHPRIVDRDVDSAEYAVEDEVLGIRRWKINSSGHLWFASPVVQGAMREGANQVFLTDVAADLMRALAWGARAARNLGASGHLAVSGTLWALGCAIVNDSRVREHSIHGRPIALQGITLGTPREANSRPCYQHVALATLETASGAAEVAAEVFRSALRNHLGADVDRAALAADLCSREARVFAL